MTRRAIIERSIRTVNQLPDEKAKEISDFEDFVMRRHEGTQLTEGIQQLTEQSQTFDFLYYLPDCMVGAGRCLAYPFSDERT